MCMLGTNVSYVKSMLSNKKKEHSFMIIKSQKNVPTYLIIFSSIWELHFKRCPFAWRTVYSDFSLIKQNDVLNN